MDTQKCLKCGYEWIGRVKNPKSCPVCKTRYWAGQDYIKCKICGRNFLNMDLHHIDGNHENNKKGNTTLICLHCHSAIHYGFKNKKRRARDYRFAEEHIKNKIIEYQNALKLARVRKWQK